MTNERPGFTLVEVIVALAIVGLALVGGLSAAAADLRTSANAIAAIRGAALADYALARARLLPPSELLRTGGSQQKRFEEPLETYRRYLEAHVVDTNTGLLEVVATVEWPNGSVRVSTRFVN